VCAVPEASACEWVAGARQGRWEARLNALQGRLADGVLANLVQYLALNQATGCLQVVGDADVAERGSGYVYLQRGRVEHVALEGVEGVAALSRLLGWRSGRFAFRVGVAAPRRTLDLSVDALLLHASYGQDVEMLRVPAGPGGNGAGLTGTRTAAGTAAAAAMGTVAGTNGVFEPTPLADPALASGLVWAAVAVAGPIGEIFVDEAFNTIGHSPRLLPETALGPLLQALAGHFKSNDGRAQFLARAEAVLAHHGYGRVEDGP